MDSILPRFNFQTYTNDVVMFNDISDWPFINPYDSGTYLPAISLISPCEETFNGNSFPD